MNTNSKYLDALIERYYEAQTTESEEQELRRLLTTGPAAANARYDEIRAVMGFLAVGQKAHAPKVQPAAPRRVNMAGGWRRGMARYAAVLMVGLLMAGGTLYVGQRLSSRNVCIAYVQGQRVTDADVVLSQMRQSMKDVTERPQELSVEAQLGDMFSTD